MGCSIFQITQQFLSSEPELYLTSKLSGTISNLRFTWHKIDFL